ncbi:TPA: hypothetical protein I7D97_003360 [Vibrio cholerae]|nr:hypothetical protein [Vibrio cholerae]HAS5424137.1 hypothetical protein [Vibrio cholerae]
MYKLPFNQWLNQRYDSPKAILFDVLSDLSQWAATYDALIDTETLNRLDNHHFNGNAKSFYLKNREGKNNQKQWGSIILGETNNIGKSTPVLIPIFLIQTYRTGMRGTFSTASFLWKKYHQESGNQDSSKPLPKKTTYTDKCVQLTNEQDKHRNLLQRMTDAAHEAAEAVTARIMDASRPISRLPEYFLECNLPESVCGELRVLEQSIQARLFSRSKEQWIQTVIYPRDIIVPIINLESGQYVNCQTISPRRNGLKKFLPGGFIEGAFSPINNLADAWVISEGYRTGLAINALDNVNVAVALSANNVPKVAKALRNVLGHDVPIFTATDNDNDGRVYASKAENESGTKRIREPDLFEGADWADVTKAFGLARAATAYHANKS